MHQPTLLLKPQNSPQTKVTKNWTHNQTTFRPKKSFLSSGIRKFSLATNSEFLLPKLVCLLRPGTQEDRFRAKIFPSKIWRKTAKFSLTEPKIQKCSKISRKKRVWLRMEIFVGTYMRPRYSPCQCS